MPWIIDGKPPQGQPVLLRLKDGSVHEGHWLKNANAYEKNVRRWRIYKTGKTVPEDEVTGWMWLPDVYGNYAEEDKCDGNQ